MRGWLAEYLRTRDKGVAATDAAYERLRFGSWPHVYSALGDNLVLEQWAAGHVRAALLSAAADSRSSYVEIPFRAPYPNAAAEHLAHLQVVLAQETFRPAFFRVTIAQERSTLKVSLFDIELLKRVERILAQKVRSA
jgi:hypothetical protein